MSGKKLHLIICICIVILSSFKNQETTITKDFVLGKFNYKTHPSFTKVQSYHATKTLYIQTRVYDSFIKMYDEAKTDGIELKILSGTRNFYEQKAIWERKWKRNANLNPLDNAKKILQYSSMPSTSRHHWGTDIDLINLSNSYFETKKGKSEYNWLVKNANKYGFYQVYTTKTSGRTGYNLEKWHWSFLPLANNYLKFYNNNVDYNDINDFKCSYLAKNLKVIETYVNGISTKAKNFN